MNCPYCDTELEYEDYFGKYLGNDRWDKKGEIYFCPNEECEHYHFYIYNSYNELFEGYPC